MDPVPGRGGHGFTLLDVTPEREQADDYLTPRPTTAVPDPRLVPSLEPALAASWQSRAASRHVTRAAAPIGQRWDHKRGWAGPAGRPRS